MPVTGFANGCFDGLHAGHRFFLTMALANCDRLVIGVNSDDSVRALKGPTRPLHRERDRIAALKAWTEEVIPFTTEQHLSFMIGRIKPDVIFKSTEYPDYKAPPARIIWVPRIPGYSTTATLAARRA